MCTQIHFPEARFRVTCKLLTEGLISGGLVVAPKLFEGSFDFCLDRVFGSLQILPAYGGSATFTSNKLIENPGELEWIYEISW
jgi:hypothetical protein